MYDSRHHRQKWLFGLVICLLWDAAPVRAQSDPQSLSIQCPATVPVTVGNLCLDKASYEVAAEVCSEYSPQTCVDTLIRQLGQIEKADRCGTQAANALLLRQEITEMVVTASLQVGGFVADVDSESVKIRAVRDRLSDQRDSAVGRSAFGGAVGTGGTAVGSALALGTATLAIAGNWVNAVFGGVGAVYGFVGYFQQKGPTGCFPDMRMDPTPSESKHQCPKVEATKDKTGPPAAAVPVKCVSIPADPCDSGGTLPRGCSPRMLYELAFPQCKDHAGFHSRYDEIIESYLDHTPSNRGQSRRQILFNTWGVTDATFTEHTQLFTGNSDPRKLSIDDLTERTNKLADLRTTVLIMNRDLALLMQDLARELRCH